MIPQKGGFSFKGSYMDIKSLKDILLTEQNIISLSKNENLVEDFNIKKLLKNNNISQSQSIRFGIVFQNFLKDIAKECGAHVIKQNLFSTLSFVQNGLKSSHKTKGKKDADILFVYKNVLYYFESKVNLNLDSEKSKETNKKVENLRKLFKNSNSIEGQEYVDIKHGIVTCWYKKEKHLPVKVNDIYFIHNYFNIFDINCTEEEYYSIFEEFGKLI
jgi:hypothetical protein